MYAIDEFSVAQQYIILMYMYTKLGNMQSALVHIL